MPGILTHYLCGDVTLKLIDNEALYTLLQKQRQAYNLGTQGPDILFYHNAWPWKKDIGIKEIGHRLHEENSGAFFKAALDYISSAADAVKELLTAYICGFACHYSLDLHTHPYIFYKTGFTRPGEADNSKYSAYHREFETTLDVLMLNKLQKQKPYDADAASLIGQTKEAASEIGKLYNALLKQVLDIDISSEQVAASISDMSSITHSLRDKSGYKRKLISCLERTMGKAGQISAMVHPVEITDQLDYLNLQHTAWFLPWDNNSPHTASFIDMFEAAAAEAETLCLAIYQGVYCGFDQDEVLGLLGNRSFTTGESCDFQRTFMHYECIYE